MPDPDYRALCAELVDSVELLLEMRAVDAKPMAITEDRVSRARAALAQPEPVMPTDEDLEDLAEVMNVSGNPVPAMRRALELWGNSQGILDSSPQPEPVAPTDAEIMEVFWDHQNGLEELWADDWPAAARAVLARWGTPANTTREESFDD